jgi:hypothetical protein
VRAAELGAFYALSYGMTADVLTRASAWRAPAVATAPGSAARAAAHRVIAAALAGDRAVFDALAPVERWRAAAAVARAATAAARAAPIQYSVTCAAVGHLEHAAAVFGHLSRDGAALLGAGGAGSSAGRGDGDDDALRLRGGAGGSSPTGSRGGSTRSYVSDSGSERSGGGAAACAEAGAAEGADASDAEGEGDDAASEALASAREWHSDDAPDADVHPQGSGSPGGRRSGRGGGGVTSDASTRLSSGSGSTTSKLAAHGDLARARAKCVAAARAAGQRAPRPGAAQRAGPGRRG